MPRPSASAQTSIGRASAKAAIPLALGLIAAAVAASLPLPSGPPGPAGETAGQTGASPSLAAPGDLQT